MNDKKVRTQMNSTIYSLFKLGREIVKLESKIINTTLNMNNNMNYVIKIFSLRQLEQLKAMIKLKKNESHILIARSMFEGSVYLGSFLKNKTLADDWRNYSYVIDKKRYDDVEDKNYVPTAVVEYLDSKKSIIDDFRRPNGTFFDKWSKKTSIKKLAESAELDHFYNNYYSKMSDYHHWGTHSFGKRYECLEKNIKILHTDEILYESLSAWCISISSILFVLTLLSQYARDLPLEQKVIQLKVELDKIDSLIFTYIQY